MQKSIDIELNAHFKQFIERQITEGRFSSVSEVIQAGLRLLEEQVSQSRPAPKKRPNSNPTDDALQSLIDALDSEGWH